MPKLPEVPDGLFEILLQPDLSAYKPAKKGQPRREVPPPDVLTPGLVYARLMTHSLLMLVAVMEERSAKHACIAGGFNKPTRKLPALDVQPFSAQEINGPLWEIEGLFLPELIEAARLAFLTRRAWRAGRLAVWTRRQRALETRLLRLAQAGEEYLAMRPIEQFCKLLGETLKNTWAYLFAGEVGLPGDYLPPPIDPTRYSSLLEMMAFGPSFQRTSEEEDEALAWRVANAGPPIG